jgi:nucleotide-binding universal stress UspA family protein
VVGLDGSRSSIDALRWAAGYASRSDATIEVVVVWDWYRNPGWYTPILAGLDPERDAHYVLEKALTDIEAEWPDVPVVRRVVQGHPSAVLTDASVGASLLVVGCRGHGEFTGMLIGSVSEYCATHAQCPVLVFREP